ncbi:hypothetical protein ACIBSV_30795 [Embleya sp. NPDC050154]|uniref:hypothetical protein n=1 Tax=unclassified Embleya TaxID=2699296 RepID=UPI0037B6A219
MTRRAGMEGAHDRGDEQRHGQRGTVVEQRGRIRGPDGATPLRLSGVDGVVGARRADGERT